MISFSCPFYLCATSSHIDPLCGAKLNESTSNLTSNLIQVYIKVVRHKFHFFLTHKAVCEYTESAYNPPSIRKLYLHLTLQNISIKGHVNHRSPFLRNKHGKVNH